MLLSHGENQYSVAKIVAEAENYRLYICKDVKTDKSCLLQIAAEPEKNGGLDRAAFVLKELKQTSDSYEKDYVKSFPDKKLNYDRLFPTVVDSFVSSEQRESRINILALKDINDINQLVPLSSLKAKDYLRISLETSAWIMGRLLKLISFIHPQGISFRQFDGSNIIIEPKEHFLIVFDWSHVLIHPNDIPLQNRYQDISNAAKAIFLAIGGDTNSGIYPYDTDHEYPKFLWQLVCQNEGDALEAHTQFYELVHNLFGYEFRPSKFLPL